MTTPDEPLACPWCAHESTDGAAFRTHLMVEHRKSELAAFVLDRRRTEARARRAIQRGEGRTPADRSPRDSPADDGLTEGDTDGEPVVR